jgi:glycosyltransferase involved in cell wall biosynthesis
MMVDPDSTASAAETIRSLLLAPDRRALLGKEGRASVLKKYSWEAVSSQFERLFEQQLRS